MSSIGPVKQAHRALIWLLALTIIATGILVAGVATGKTSFAPKLALDLEGGTQMILAPRVQGDESIDQDQLEQAVEIIRQRVDGSGVSEAEITTQSGSNVVVSMPGVPDTKTRELIQASANMEFRPVLITGASRPPRRKNAPRRRRSPSPRASRRTPRTPTGSARSSTRTSRPTTAPASWTSANRPPTTRMSR